MQEAEVPVKLGAADTVKAVLGENNAILIDKSQKNLITTEMTLEPEVAAPVSKGQRLGTFTVKAGDRILMEIPLVAAKPVERLTFGDLFLKTLRRAAMAG
jgi:D-alanyl-D-alanine carboxypeptidase (penicillin-binding protein 5/6)